MHYLLIYDVGDDFIKRREEFRDEHLSLALAHGRHRRPAAGRGTRGADRAGVPAVPGDVAGRRTEVRGVRSYVRHGLVRRWRVKQWNTVVGNAAASPKKPNGV